ncbi:3-carboxy-cis,cis-muconate cycloisomerase [Streptomyces sp. NBC_01013]|uniref:3-carboxy-cis,cis-muconate cycloisomerase n=1 Tax=Streptomyces sp. NBC_01013 TaxID=2903718 RepID=UPI00386D8411|nr:3-carboxy-cis,cis-muconate cycloisomerase [Streptomyces sp. NBC_01013]
MTSDEAAADVGLLAPVRAGTAVENVTGDAAYVRALLDAEVALARAQESLGRAPAGSADAIASAARDAARFDPRLLALRARPGGNPVIPLAADLTAAVAEESPEAAAHVHRGATSQDILDTAAMLVASEALRLILADLDRAAAALATTAAEHRDTPMAGRTLTQHAVPTTFGLKAAGWRSLVLDAHDRTTAVRAALPVQLGGAAGTLAAFAAFAGSPNPVMGTPDAPGDETGTEDTGLGLVEAYATATGLAVPSLPWHTLRTPVADLGGALAFTAGALGKFAADVLVLSRTEIGEVAESTGGGSSAMPHKANPARAVLIASAARQVPALAGILYGALAAEDERPPGAWHAEWQPLREALRMVGGAAEGAAGLAEGLRVRPGRMRENLDATGGLIVSERIVAVLSARIGRSAARTAVTDGAARAAGEGLDLHEVLAQDPALAGVVPPDELRALSDPSGYTGSAGPLVDRALRRRTGGTVPE